MQAIELLRQVSTPHGFLATPTDRHNYRRVWARDSVVTGLAALVSEDTQLIETFRQSLLTLAKYQGKAGQILAQIHKGFQIGCARQSALRTDIRNQNNLNFLMKTTTLQIR